MTGVKRIADTRDARYANVHLEQILQLNHFRLEEYGERGAKSTPADWVDYSKSVSQSCQASNDILRCKHVLRQESEGAHDSG